MECMFSGFVDREEDHIKIKNHLACLVVLHLLHIYFFADFFHIY